MKQCNALRTLTLLGCSMIACLASARQSYEASSALDSSENLYMAVTNNTAKLNISKINSAGTSGWDTNFAPPSGWHFVPFGIQLKLDGSNNIYVAVQLVNTALTNDEIEIIKMPSTGASSVSTIYSQTSGAVLSGLTVDGPGNLYIIGTSNQTTPIGFIAQYNATLTTVHSQGFSVGGFTTTSSQPMDIVRDSANNIYVGTTATLSGSTHVAMYDKYTSTGFTSGPAQETAITLPSGYTGNQFGTLTIDSLQRVTYAIGMTSSSGAALFAAQFNTASGATYWEKTFTGSNYQEPAEAVVDSSGNIDVLGWIISNSNYEYGLLQISSAGALNWSTTYSYPAYAPNPYALALDKGGDIEVGDTIISGGISEAQIQNFISTTGAYSFYYYYYGTGHQDSCYSLQTSPSTSGTLYSSGDGIYSGTDYPEHFKIAGDELYYIWYLTS